MADHSIDTPPRPASPVQGFGTLAVHAGTRPDPVTGAVIAPISLSTKFLRKEPDPKSTKIQQAKAKKQQKRDRTVILIKESLTNYAEFDSQDLRTKINTELSKNRQVIYPVVATITKSIAQNLIVTTTTDYSADFLLQKTNTLAKFIKYKEAKRDIALHKVAIHGITLHFDTPDMAQRIKDEINTFNKHFRLQVVGRPSWLISESKRLIGQRSASMVMAFATEGEQTRANRNRLNIGEISVRVEKVRDVLPSTQYTNCCGYGHLQQRYPKSTLYCGFCAGKYHTREHACTTCHILGSVCEHTQYKRCNCSENHTAYSKDCSLNPICQGKPLRILSINANTSQEVTEDFLQQGIELEIDVILSKNRGGTRKTPSLQKTTSPTLPPTSHQSYMQISINHEPHLQPRKLTYVAKTCQLNINLAQESPTDTDLQIVTIADGQTTVQVVNIYNQTGIDGGNTNTFKRNLEAHTPHANSIIVGDFNHTP